MVRPDEFVPCRGLDSAYFECGLIASWDRSKWALVASLSWPCERVVTIIIGLACGLAFCPFAGPWERVFPGWLGCPLGFCPIAGPVFPDCSAAFCPFAGLCVGGIFPSGLLPVAWFFCQ